MRRARVTLDVEVEDHVDLDEMAEQVFDLVCSDELDRAPLVEVVEHFDVEELDRR